MSHWYKLRGERWEACHFVTNKKGGTRPTTLADARKMLLVPSVTTILDRVLHKPALLNWKVRQGILSALTLPRREDEDLDAYAERVAYDMDSEGRAARDFGGRIHSALEKILANPQARVDSDLEPYLESARKWIASSIEEILGTEQTVGNDVMGYAGRYDLRARVKIFGESVIDFKTQGIKRGPVFYEEWPLQLSAYSNASPSLNRIRTISVIVNSAEPGPVYCHVWDDDGKAWEMFRYCLEIWKYLTGYDPGLCALLN